MLTGLEETVCHADDILISGSTREQHDHRLHKVLEQLQFTVDKVMFLGHIVSAWGIEH